MKILFYTNILSDGGAERVLVNLANHFARSGHAVILVATYETPNEYPQDSSVKRLNLENPASAPANPIIRNIRRISALRAILKSETPDVAVSFMREANIRIIPAAFGLRTKTVVSVRNDPKRAYGGLIGRLISKWVMPLADGCVFQTTGAKAFFPAGLQKKSAVIFNAVKDEFFSIVRNPEKNRIVCLGRLNKQKNYPMVLAAFHAVVQHIPDAKLSIYGEGELHTELAQAIRRMGLSESVFLMGRTDNVQKVHETADLYVMSSDFEGMPNSLMEAMAAGVPVISTDCPCGGPGMLIDNGESGLLIPVGDASAMAEAIEKVLRDDALKARLSAGAKDSARSFRPELINQKWESYLTDVIRGTNKN